MLKNVGVTDYDQAFWHAQSEK